MIPVTKCFFARLKEFTNQVNRAFNNEYFTKQGEPLIAFDAKIENYLDSMKLGEEILASVKQKERNLLHLCKVLNLDL